MTNAQKWVALVFVFFIALLALGRLTNSSENSMSNSNIGEQQNEENLDGMALITKIGCVSCHGSDLNGSPMAPSLLSVKEYWTRDNLINYLRNPSSYNGDKRFENYKQMYNRVMPSYNNIDVKQLGTIADYLLQLK